jgi:hypothetical protein
MVGMIDGGGTEVRSETQLIMARLRVHVVFAIIQRLLTLDRSFMKPELYVGRPSSCKTWLWLRAFDDELSAISIRN